ncbi:2-phospho-L-lactate guanylyltransferase [Dietzia sp. ANT_WB102]|uniref:2-phospho-L-lactate guanylyltransferase n=1 Tax=Dietzia sp. ANT_WB102 TaxID=2597345 RepID=UPI0011ED5335|nr:2-phospho-L-lactate guanylyltransferase [Dietzia sp. ANT_WB102]KAA0919506.1 2-phospho-L-lactate guanylyltransferase [Dietzia sp. ANT_WB102]
MSTAGVSEAAVGGWTIVVPVKSLDRAKSRLVPALTGDARRALVVAMAADVLRACRDTPGVVRVRVVSADPRVEDLALRTGAEFVDEPADSDSPHGDPLNFALDRALGDVTGPAGVVTADLPELRPEHLSRILDVASRHPHATVTDHRGAGTTMAFWTGAPATRVCRFGLDSAARYRVEGGAVPIAVKGDLDAAARDVDVPGDLAALPGRSVGPATAGALRDPSVRLLVRANGVSATMVP